jgi:hypothetical protein
MSLFCENVLQGRDSVLYSIYSDQDLKYLRSKIFGSISKIFGSRSKIVGARSEIFGSRSNITKTEDSDMASEFQTAALLNY